MATLEQNVKTVTVYLLAIRAEGDLRGLSLRHVGGLTEPGGIQRQERRYGEMKELQEIPFPPLHGR